MSLIQKAVLGRPTHSWRDSNSFLSLASLFHSCLNPRVSEITESRIGRQHGNQSLLCGQVLANELHWKWCWGMFCSHYDGPSTRMGSTSADGTSNEEQIIQKRKKKNYICYEHVQILLLKAQLLTSKIFACLFLFVYLTCRDTERD